MKGLCVALVLLTGCASFNVDAFGVPVDGRNVYAASQNPADEPGDRTESHSYPWWIGVILITAGAFGVYVGSSS